MSRRVAVLADAVSSDAIFPAWHRYYSRLFGSANLFLVTYAGRAAEFDNVEAGGILQLPLGYEDSLRQKFIGQFTATLLKCFDVVIRTDIDEFLVVDPRVAPSLATYVADMDDEYITSRGFDVVQLADEPAVSVAAKGPLLSHRSFAYPNSALNKTSIVRTPLSWSSGFHWSTVYPKFGPIFMLHLKRFDINWQLAWYRKMYTEIEDNQLVSNSIKSYYFPDQDKIERYHRDVTNRPRVSGIDMWYRDEFTANFVKKLKYEINTGMYVGEYGHEHILCEIIPEWKELF